MRGARDLRRRRELEVFDEVPVAGARDAAESAFPSREALLDRAIADRVHAGRDTERLRLREVGFDFVVGKSQFPIAGTIAVGRNEGRRPAAERPVEKDVAADIGEAER